MTKEKIKKEKKVDKKEEVSRYASVLVAPIVTEKANFLMQNNIFAFEVSANSTKREIIKAMKDIHKITPVKVNIVKLPAKKVFYKGKRGMVGGIKKAYITLKKGDKITNL